MEAHFKNWKPGDLTAEEFDRAVEISHNTLCYKDLRDYPIFNESLMEVCDCLRHQPYDQLEQTFDADGYMYNDFDDFELLQESVIKY